MKTNIDQLLLTPKQQRFCDEYLLDLNATRAALRAGYSAATALNGQLMAIPKIKEYLQQRTNESSHKLHVTYDTLLAELAKIAFANMGDYFGDDGKIKAMNELTNDQKAAIWNIKVTDDKNGTTVQLRLHNKLTAIEKMAKHIQFYNTMHEPPEKVYVYLDKEQLDADDRFEDDSFGVNDLVSCELPVVGCELEEVSAELPVVNGEVVNTELAPLAELSFAEVLALDGDKLGSEERLMAAMNKQPEAVHTEPVAKKPNRDYVPFGKWRDRNDPRYINAY